MKSLPAPFAGECAQFFVLGCLRAQMDREPDTHYQRLAEHAHRFGSTAEVHPELARALEALVRLGQVEVYGDIGDITKCRFSLKF